MRRRAKPAKAKVKAKRPAARKSPKNEGARARDLQKRLAESLAQQKATAEILKVISSTPTDAQPVFDTIVRNAGRVCDAVDAVLSLRKDNELTIGAHWGPIGVQLGRRAPLTEGSVMGRAIVGARPIHVEDLLTASEFPEGRELAIKWGHRTTLGVPLLREGKALGALLVRRREVRPFSDAQIAMLQTFADQAVIAIENVRLFNETKEALEQQTAAAEILRVISSSPTDTQPVFDMIAENAQRLCDGHFCAVFRFDGELIHLAGHHGLSPDGAVTYERGFPLRPGRDSAIGRAILDRALAQIPDVQADPEYGQLTIARAVTFRAIAAVPMLRDEQPVGGVAVSRSRVGPFSDKQLALLKTFADQAVIAIENARLLSELQQKNESLTQAHAQVSEALEQQTATAEILKVISGTPTDAQPVFDTIVQNAGRVCDAVDGTLVLRKDDQLIIGAHWGPIGAVVGTRVPLTRGSVMGRTIHDARPIHIEDLQSASDFPEGRELALQWGHRTTLGVPLLREGEALGALLIRRTEVRPFSDAQIAMLQTFADQAVIAIENVRLFTELQEKNQAITKAHAQVTEALEQQTATAEILRVISSSLTDIQPVLDAVVRSAARLCEAYDAWIGLTEGEQVRVLAHHGPIAIAQDLRPLGRGRVSERAIVDREPVHVHDLSASAAEFPQGQVDALKAGHRTTLGVPLLREGKAIGVILIRRLEVRPFTDTQIALLQTFADQAVIAIENVRLFTELQASNRELTSALDTQTATSDILRIISRSQTNIQPVFDAIVASAVRLLGAYTGALTRIEGDQIDLAALTGHDAAGAAAVRAPFPLSLQSEVPHARAIRDRAPLNIAEYQTDPRVPEDLRTSAAIRGYRSLVVVPMLLHDEAIGSIGVTRREPGGFTHDEIALLKTFADQAVIAIENARLLSELQERNEALTQAHAQVSEALEQQTATAEILRVISRSPIDVQPVFDTIVKSAVRLCDGLFGGLFRFDGELLHHVAQHNHTPEALEEVHRVFPGRPTRTSHPGRAILERAVVHVPDVERDPEFQHQAVARAIGLRSVLYVPMLRKGAPIGVIGVARVEPGPFSGSQIELLQTFADQAVIAVENARLFAELQARTNELTRSVDQLTALGEISQAVSSTLDVETVLQTIVSRASQLAGADGCAIYEYDDATEAFHIRAAHSLGAALVEKLRASPLRKGEGIMGRAAEAREPIQVADIAAPGAYKSHIRDTLLAAGYRALLSVPLLREGEIIGSLSLNRHEPGEFPPEAVEVLKTFATQSALAIQNARLFREIADKSRQLEVASQHKSEFLANMSHELRTPLNAIIGFSEVLNERMFGELNDKQAEYLRDIHASGTHLLSLINDILDLSKVEAGRMELELTDFDLPAALDSAVMLVRERASRKGVTVRIAVEAEIGAMRGDERKIRQVLLNLLSNAIKFTPEGGRIEVAAVPNGGSVEVSVRDTGVGIAPADHEAVFEEFRQVGAADKKAEGTGLGLALARKFIELHGGKIWVTSQVGAGSTFTFTLPLQRPSEA